MAKSSFGSAIVSSFARPLNSNSGVAFSAAGVVLAPSAGREVTLVTGASVIASTLMAAEEDFCVWAFASGLLGKSSSTEKTKETRDRLIQNRPSFDC